MSILKRVAPELPVRDMTEALAHYRDVLGFGVVTRIGNGEYAIVERDDVALHLFTDRDGGHSAASIHVFATELDGLLAELQRRGAHVSEGIVHRPWGNRDFRVIDPAGNTLKFTEPASDRE